MDNILITAGTGKVGREASKQLLDKGINFKAGTRNPENVTKVGLPAENAVKFSFEDSGTWENALSNVNKVFIILPSSLPGAEINVMKFLDSAVTSGVKNIVLMSAMGADKMDTPLRKIEKHIENSGIDFTIIRPSWFMQNFVTFHLDMIKNSNSIFLPCGNGKSGFIDARDIAATGIESLMNKDHSGKAYNLTGSQSLDHNKVAEIISKAAGKEVKYVDVPDDAAREGMLQAGMPDQYVSFMIMLYNGVKAGYSDIVTPDVKTVLGREPISFEQFANDYADFWK